MFQVATIPTLGAGQFSIVYEVTLILPVRECATLSTGANVFAGTMVVTVLPAGSVLSNGHVLPSDAIKATYYQSEGLNDNRYGTGATAATGWSGGHSFGNLVGSDKLEFRLTNKLGVTVLDFYMDTITGVASETFPSGTVNYPSGYGTRGANGAEGSLVSGLLTNVLLVQTGISENLRKPQFQSGFLVNSPAETAPLSGISVIPGWDYRNSFTAIVKGSTFGPGGVADFGSVIVPDQHNSPAKAGGHVAVPSPCDSVVCNVATATATANGVAVTPVESGKVCVKITTGTGSPGGGGPANITAGAPTIKDKKLTIELTNTGGTLATIQKIDFAWPAGNKKLKKVKNGKPTIFDAGASPSSVSITTFKGNLSDRQIPAGGKVRLTFEFETNANADKTLYDLAIDFGAGLVTFIP